MKNEHLVITKDNYKGYIELYNVRSQLTKEEQDSIKSIVKKTVVTFFSILLALMITVPLEALGLISKLIVNAELLVFATTEVFFLIKYAKETKYYDKKKKNEIKEKYPYVDLEIGIVEIFNSLQKAKIISYNGDNEYEFRVKEYEDFLKAEEIKKIYFEETKYKGYTVNLGIEPQELEKPKVKKLVR